LLLLLSLEIKQEMLVSDMVRHKWCRMQFARVQIKPKKAMRHVSISGDTLPHPVLGTHDGGKVMLRPARQGTGIIAGGGVRAVLEAAGVKNVLSKSLGSNNQLSVVSATLDGLLQLRTASQISEIRGETVFGPSFTQEQPKVQVPVETKSE